MAMCIIWFLQNYFKKCILTIVLGRFHMGTLGAKRLIKNLSVTLPSSGVQVTCPTCHTLNTPPTLASHS